MSDSNLPRVSVKVPSKDRGVLVKVRPPESRLYVMVATEGEALEVKVYPEGLQVEVFVLPADADVGPIPVSSGPAIPAGPAEPPPPPPFGFSSPAPSKAESSFIMVESKDLDIFREIAGSSDTALAQRLSGQDGPEGQDAGGPYGGPELGYQIPGGFPEVPSGGHPEGLPEVLHGGPPEWPVDPASSRMGRISQTQALLAQLPDLEPRPRPGDDSRSDTNRATSVAHALPWADPGEEAPSPEDAGLLPESTLDTTIDDFIAHQLSQPEQGPDGGGAEDGPAWPEALAETFFCEPVGLDGPRLLGEGASSDGDYSEPDPLGPQGEVPDQAPQGDGQGEPGPFASQAVLEEHLSDLGDLDLPELPDTLDDPSEHVLMASPEHGFGVSVPLPAVPPQDGLGLSGDGPAQQDGYQDDGSGLEEALWAPQVTPGGQEALAGDVLGPVSDLPDELDDETPAIFGSSHASDAGPDPVGGDPSEDPLQALADDAGPDRVGGDPSEDPFQALADDAGPDPVGGDPSDYPPQALADESDLGPGDDAPQAWETGQEPEDDDPLAGLDDPGYDPVNDPARGHSGSQTAILGPVAPEEGSVGFAAVAEDADGGEASGGTTQEPQDEEVDLSAPLEPSREPWIDTNIPPALPPQILYTPPRPVPKVVSPEASTAVIVSYLDDADDNMVASQGQSGELAEEEDMDIDLMDMHSQEPARFAARPMVPVPKTPL
ncbi:MAG: hypothetical protein LBL95_02500 [Deltaproteobacteria bacterium]|jgi:hypothetical protein|nr:hypothetical protein [Deltaproteobacteria bacterium]